MGRPDKLAGPTGTNPRSAPGRSALSGRCPAEDVARPALTEDHRPLTPSPPTVLEDGTTPGREEDATHSTFIDAAALETCVWAAVAAPSIHNSQPWRFRLDQETVTFQVRAAPGGGLRHTDPEGRAPYLPVGACVLNLRVAVAGFGWGPVTHLLPHPEEPDLLASVRPAEPATGRPRGGDIDLDEAIWRRHSSRFPFSDRTIPPHLRVQLATAAGAEGARLRFPEGAAAARLLALTADGEQRNRRAADRSTESRRWVRGDPDAEADTGPPWAVLGPRTPGSGSPSPPDAVLTDSPPAPARRPPSSPS